MNAHDTEICGFLDVKLIGDRYIVQRVRKKALISSKIWKRHWCSVKKLESGLGVQIQFNNMIKHSSSISKQDEKSNSVIIPPSAIIYRFHSKTKQFAFALSLAKDKKPLLSLSANSETESQRWMANIRYLLKSRRYCMEKSYNVSMVDNAHSRAAGLTGLYGDLTANETGVFIKNVHMGNIIESFEWKEFGQFHLMTAGRPEDVKRICVIHTTKEFRCGIGELYLFCLDAYKLLQNLVTQGRGPKQKLSSLSFNDGNHEASMRYNEIITLPSQQKNNALHSTFNIGIDRTSDHTKTAEHIYQTVPASLIYREELHSSNLEESDISIASGIYEEIVEDVYSSKLKKVTSNVYKNTDTILCTLQMTPPPLPPRQRQKSECIQEDSMINIGQYSYAQVLDLKEKLPSIEICRNSMQENSLLDNYVPMSPQLRSINIFKSNAAKKAKDDEYVVMR